MIFVDWWTDLEQIQQIFWSVAIVSSLLLFILVFISLFGVEPERETKARTDRRRSRLTEPQTVLVALTVFGWTAVLLSYWLTNNQTILVLSAVAGLIGGMLPWLFSPVLGALPLDPDAMRTSTGEVLTSIPPHRNGFGKVHLNLRAAPFEMDAVTAGEELPPGVPVRVVEVIDERVLLVEALIESEEEQPADDKEQKDQGPAGPGLPRGSTPRR